MAQQLETKWFNSISIFSELTHFHSDASKSSVYIKQPNKKCLKHIISHKFTLTDVIILHLITKNGYQKSINRKENLANDISGSTQ